MNNQDRSAGRRIACNVPISENPARATRSDADEVSIPVSEPVSLVEELPIPAQLLDSDASMNGDEQSPFTLEFDWTTPPLTLNQRMHWRRKAALTREVRTIAGLCARSIPPMRRCRVELVWVVTDKRRRDADNLVATLKALCDGLVDARVVRDDTPAFMDKRMPAIVYRPGEAARFLLTVTEIA